LPASREPDQTTAFLIDALWQFWREWRLISHPVRKGEITPEQYWLLKRLARRGPMNISELAQGLGITNSSATTAAQRLEKSGLVVRERQQSDERIVLVRLTDTGREVLQRWAQRQRQALAELLAPLSPEERASLLHLLQKLLPRT
jgi:DNA-binding MarR family transcriptional regulator